LQTHTKDWLSPGFAGQGEIADRLLAALLAVAIAIPAFMTGDLPMKPLFYVLVILPTLGFVLSGRLSLREIKRDSPAVLLLVIPLFYWSATNLWSANPEYFQAFLRRSLTVFVFVLGVAHVARTVGRDLVLYLDLSLYLVGIGAALILIKLPFVEPPGPLWRPGDGSVFNRALHASHYFGFFATYALARYYQLGDRKKALACLAAGFLCLLFVFTTESRGTLVSMVLVGLTVSLYWHRRYLHALALVLVCVVGFLLMHEILLERGLSFRRDIWVGSLELMKEHFWLGVGMGTNLEIPYAGKFLAPHAHNQLLDLQVKSGLAGLLLFLPVVGFVLWRVVSPRPGEQVFAATLLFFLLCVMTDVHKLVNSPTTSYIIFWMPLVALLVVSRQVDAGEGGASLPADEDKEGVL
jgi:O-antigen ligase